jgi:hypothetical protein
MSWRLLSDLVAVTVGLTASAAAAGDQHDRSAAVVRAPVPETAERRADPARPDVPAMASPTVNLPRDQELAQTALTHVLGANAALDKNDIVKARIALDVSTSALRQLYLSVPAEKVADQLASDDAVDLDLALVLAELRSQSSWMDPQIVTLVEEAESHRQKGHRKLAEEKLQQAGEALIDDVALLPIEDAYARAQAARTELRDGNTVQARRLIRALPDRIMKLQATAPLMPARFSLRVAATAAEEGQWDRASQLVREATQDLERVLAASSTPFDRRVKSVLNRAKRLSRLIERGARPLPRDLRELARETHTLARTL